MEVWGICGQPESSWGLGEICGSGAGILGGCGDSPALGSGMQLPVQSHREAEEATRVALLAQGAHHVQIEGDSPGAEQSGQQGAKKVTSPGGPARTTARSPRHAANLARASHERKKTRSRPKLQVSHGRSLVSSLADLSGVSQSLALLPSPAAPPPQHPLGQLQRPQPKGELGLPPPLPGAPPRARAPPSTPPLAPAAGGGFAASQRDARASDSG